MIKVIEDDATMVDFINESNVTETGKLLTYEICGEACVLVNSERVWVPFSYLTQKSQIQILKSPTKNDLFKESMVVLVITLLVLILYTVQF